MKVASKLLSILSAFVLFTMSLTACNQNEKEVKKLVGMTSQQRQQALARMSPEQQVSVYLAAAEGEPGHDFSHEIAGSWGVLLPVVKRHLVSERGDAERKQLLWLLAAISEQCSLADREDVLEAGYKAVAGMKSANRKYGEEPMSRIIRSANHLPPCNN